MLELISLPKKEKALNVALNKISGEWDFRKLTNLLNDLDFENVSLTGFEQHELDELEKEFGKDKQKEESEKEFDIDKAHENLKNIIKPGMFFKLGDHEVYCNDSFNENIVKNIVNDRFIDMIYTDPPYDMNMGGKGCFASSTVKLKARIDELIHFDANKISYIPNLDVGTYYIYTSKNGIKK